jgi:hypothetical protein
METHETKDEWIVLEENDPPPDLDREDAAFERVRDELLRQHRGKVALVHGDDVVGVYKDANEASLEGHRLLGWARMVCYAIIERNEEPEYIPNVDVTHPSFKPD